MDRPITREEKYLAYLTEDYKGDIQKPITRKEKYLHELCLKGMGVKISPEEIQNAVNDYLKENPVQPEATAEQVQQIKQNQKDITSLKEDKIDKPVEAPTVGTILKVKSVNENGTFVCEWGEGGGNLDVQIDGQSIVKDGVAEIPRAKYNKIGLMGYVNEFGVYCDSGSIMHLTSITPDDWRKNNIYNNCAVTLLNFEKYIKAAMCDGKGAAWTEEEQAAARERMGAADKRQLDALWKLNQGISYKFEEDNAVAYQKTIPTGAKVASIKQIVGKTIVWNQLLGTGYEKTKTSNGITFTNNNDGSITIDGTATADVMFQINCNNSFSLYGGHIYLWNIGTTVDGIMIGNNNYTQFFKKAVSKWTMTQGRYYGYNCIKVVSGTTVSNVTVKPQLFDLTLMFGEGNEPSTVEEFKAMFPTDYYPYNARELMNAPVNEVVEQGKNLFGGKVLADKIVELGGVLNEAEKTVSFMGKRLNGKTIFEFPDSKKRYTIILVGKNTENGANGIPNVIIDNKHYVTSFNNGKMMAISNVGEKALIGLYADGGTTLNYDQCGIFEGVLTYDDFKSYYETYHSIPQAILDLDGYGCGVDNVYNYVDWENKKYHKCIGKYTITGDEAFYSNQSYIGDNTSNAYMSMNIGQKQSTDAKLISNKLLYSKWCWSEDLTYDAMCLNNTQIHIRISNSSLGITTNEASAEEVQNAIKNYCKNLYESGNPIVIYYELAEEEVADISDIVGDTFQEPLEIESGGSLTFKNTNGDDYRIPVANTEEYLISLAEVAK